MSLQKKNPANDILRLFIHMEDYPSEIVLYVLDNIDKIETANALFYYSYSHLRKYGWACPSRNGIRIQSDITVSASNIHKSVSVSHRIAENHNAYNTRLTRFRAESLLNGLCVIRIRSDHNMRCLSFQFHCSHISWPHIDRLISKIAIHLYRMRIGIAFFLFFFFRRAFSPKCHSALHTHTKRILFLSVQRER